MKRKYDIDEIIDKGLEVIRTKGYTNTGIEDILAVNGIPKGSFYNFFLNKEEFGIRAMQKYTARQVAWVREVLQQEDKTPLQRLQDFYGRMIEINMAEDCSRGCLIGNMTQEMAGLSVPIADQANRSLAQISEVIGACVAEGQSGGEIRTDYAAQELADYLHNSFYGFLLRSKAGQNRKHFDIFMEMVVNFLKK